MSIYIAVVLLLFGVPAFAQNPADLEKLTVLEDRTKPGGRKIELAFARLKSTAAKPGSPIVYLDGGPGGSGIGLYRVAEYQVLFDAMRAAGDVILLSQRGTGFSTPRLTCRGAAPHPERSVRRARQRMIEVLGAALDSPAPTSCARKGIDLAAYNTEASADDLEDLRKTLGVPKISLFGFSYGTHLAWRRFGAIPASIDRVILAGTEGPDDSQKYPAHFRSAAGAPGAARKQAPI